MFIIIILVVLAGIYAGLTLALFGIKLTTLERRIRIGDKEAEKVYKVRKHGYLLLCSLLLGNVASYTIMSVYLGSITSGVIASAIATALIFIFGEILPQAIFPKYALAIGAKLTPVVWLTMVIFYPISAPIAWGLNKLIGKEPPEILTKRELGEIIKYHKDFGDGVIDKDEERIILGALSFSELTAEDIMIPKYEVFFLNADTIISASVLLKIKNEGYSRIPVYNQETKKVEGILHLVDLLDLFVQSERKVRDVLRGVPPIFLDVSIKLDSILNLLTTEKIHMAVVQNSTKEFIGILTLEDIMEEILKMELGELKK